MINEVTGNDPGPFSENNCSRPFHQRKPQLIQWRVEQT